MKSKNKVDEKEIDNLRIAVNIKLNGVETPEQRKAAADYIREKANDVEENISPEEWNKNISFKLFWS